MSDILGGLHVHIEADPTKLTLKVKIRNNSDERPEGIDHMIAVLLLMEMRKACAKATEKLAERISEDGDVQCITETREK